MTWRGTPITVEFISDFEEQILLSKKINMEKLEGVKTKLRL